MNTTLKTTVLLLLTFAAQATPTVVVTCIGGADGTSGFRAIPVSSSICHYLDAWTDNLKVFNGAEAGATLYARNDFQRETGYLETSSYLIGVYPDVNSPKLLSGYGNRYHAPRPGWRGVYAQRLSVWQAYLWYRQNRNTNAKLKYVVISPGHDYLHSNTFGVDPYKVPATYHPAYQSSRRAQMSARIKKYEDMIRSLVAAGITPVIINMPPYAKLNLKTMLYGKEWLHWKLDEVNYNYFIAKRWNSIGSRILGVVHVGTGDWEPASIWRGGVAMNGDTPLRMYPSPASAKRIASRILNVIKR